jgi:hypothetical protein
VSNAIAGKLIAIRASVGIEGTKGLSFDTSVHFRGFNFGHEARSSAPKYSVICPREFLLSLFPIDLS